MSECVQTEALTHQTMPWTGAGERRTVFFKYSPKALTWSSVSFSPLRLLSINNYEPITLSLSLQIGPDLSGWLMADRISSIRAITRG